MSIRIRGNCFAVDVKVAGAQNPSGQPVRVRLTAPTLNDAKRLEMLIRAEITVHGRYVPHPGDADMGIARRAYLAGHELAELERQADELKAALDAFVERARDIIA